MSEPNNQPQNENSATASQGTTLGNVLGDSAKLAAGYAAAKAEATKITSVSLPSAYTALGQHAYESNDDKIAADRPEPAKLAEIDKKLADMAASVEQKNAAAETFSEKAKAMASAATSAGQRQLLLRNKNKTLAALGEYVFLHSESGPKDLRDTITTLRERLTTLQAQVERGKEEARELRGKTKVLAASVSSGASKTGVSSLFTRRRLAWIGGVFAVIFLYGAYLQRVENQTYSKAHQLWDADNRAEAVELYTPLVNRSTSGSTDNKAKAFLRVIEFQCEQDDLEAARALIEKANREGITLALTNPTATAIQEDVQEQVRLANEPKSSSSETTSSNATGDARGSDEDDLSPTFLNPELKELAGRFVQNEIRPGWSLEKVLAVMGTPTKIERSNGLLGQTPQQQSKFLADPLIPPSVKRSMQEETAICTWSSTEDPGSYFIKLWFQDGVLSDDDLSVSIVLPK